MVEKITLDLLTVDSVSVKKQQYTVVDGQEYAIGQPHRKAYVNSVRGRAEVMSELPGAQKNAIFAVWGNAPTVEEREGV
jgi:hypothetical protein